MEQFVLLIRTRDWEIFIDFYSVSNSDNPEQTFRDAIKEYLLTEEGMNDIKDSNDDFNWGDAVLSVPETIWNKHGIKTIREEDMATILNPFVILVKQDEVLVPQ